ncbi:MAG: GGDEF domain-containing protein [Steroidobacterales bacterium]
MNTPPMKALFVFDGRDDFRHPDRTIIDDGSVVCDMIDVERLNGKLRRLGAPQPQVVLLDSTWPAARLLKAAMRVREAMPKVPVLLLPDLRNEFFGPQAVQAYDDSRPTTQASKRTSMLETIRYAVRQHRVQQKLMDMALTDELTGLYNRRAFRVLASQSLRLAHRVQRRLLLIFADLDGLKQINDRFGHREGDRALSRAAAAIKGAFDGKGDIVARLGGDEFVALVEEQPGMDVQLLCSVLRARVAARGARERRYDLSLSVGVARFNPGGTGSLSDLLAEADEALYRHKRARAEGSPAAGGVTELPTAPRRLAVGRMEQAADRVSRSVAANDTEWKPEPREVSTPVMP